MLTRTILALGLFVFVAEAQMARLKDIVIPVQTIAETDHAPIAVTPSTATDRFAVANNPLVDGASGYFASTGTVPAPLDPAVKYFVVQRRTGDFRVSTSLGGGLVNITSNGTGIVTFVPDGWVHFPQRAIGQGYAMLALSLDRSALIGNDFSPLMELAVEMSLDGGATWGGTWTDPATQVQYSLELGFGAPDGQLINPRTGEVVLTSSLGQALPQPTSNSRLIRGRYRIWLTRTWGFFLDLQ
jgi:hypothetical protein